MQSVAISLPSEAISMQSVAISLPSEAISMPSTRTVPLGATAGADRNQCQSACHRLGRYLWVQRRGRIAISANQHALTLWVGGRIAISANQHALTLWVGGRIANGGGESGSAIARWFSKHAAHGAI